MNTKGDLASTLDLLERSRATLAESARADSATDRYVHAHLGALRAGAALMAARGGVRRGRMATVWESLAVIAPELGEWSAYFAVCGDRRRRIEAGGAAPSRRESDDLLRAGETFLGLVQAALGLPVAGGSTGVPALEPILASAGR